LGALELGRARARGWGVGFLVFGDVFGVGRVVLGNVADVGVRGILLGSGEVEVF